MTAPEYFELNFDISVSELVAAKALAVGRLKQDYDEHGAVVSDFSAVLDSVETRFGIILSEEDKNLFACRAVDVGNAYYSTPSGRVPNNAKQPTYHRLFGNLLKEIIKAKLSDSTEPLVQKLGYVGFYEMNLNSEYRRKRDGADKVWFDRLVTNCGY